MVFRKLLLFTLLGHQNVWPEVSCLWCDPKFLSFIIWIHSKKSHTRSMWVVDVWMCWSHKLVDQDLSNCSVQFSHSVVSDSLRPQESQHTRPPCPSPTPGVHSNSCSSSGWCHPAISYSVVPFSFSQSPPASESFPMSQLFTWGGRSIGVSALAPVLPMNTQDWSLGWTGWISLQSKGLSTVFSNTIVQKHQCFSAQFSSQSNSHIHTWPLENHSLD